MDERHLHRLVRGSDSLLRSLKQTHWLFRSVHWALVPCFSSSLPRAPQDLRWWVAGQAVEEDVGHEGEPRPGLLVQVGLREGPVEVRTLRPRRLSEGLSCLGVACCPQASCPTPQSSVMLISAVFVLLYLHRNKPVLTSPFESFSVWSVQLNHRSFPLNTTRLGKL